MEPIETQANKRWQLRMVLVALGFAVFAAWFAYDGAVAYPGFNQRATLYNQLVIDEARRDEWLALAKEKGWPPAFDVELLDTRMRVRPKTQTDIQVQIGLALFCLLAAGALIVRVLRHRNRYMILDDNELVTFDGRSVPLASVIEVDRSRWERKSIAVVHYTDEDGKRRKVVLDDWIHDGMEDILKRIEQVLPKDTQAAEGVEAAEEEA